MKRIFFSLLLLSAGLISAGGVRAQESDCQQLKKEYDKVLADRDNLVAQVKLLLSSREKNNQLEEMLRKAREENAKNLSELEKLQAQNIQQRKDLDQEVERLQQEVGALKSERDQQVKDREGLNNSLEKLKIEYKILPETKRDLMRLENQKSMLQKDIAKLELKIRRLEDERLDKDAQIEIFRRQIKEQKFNYDQAMAKNRALEKKVEELPGRFAELSRQNKLLVKETALMHYNLGVFYTKNQEYDRAIAEFEKCIELNADDAYAHYNLGYIYAEYLVNRPKAIEHFKRFLSLVKTDDKDVDWVRKYILTWQTWEGKTTIK